MTGPIPPLTLEDWLRAAYAGDKAGCPPPEAFLEAETEGLAPAERRRLEEHADRCPACAAERDLARLFDSGPQAARIKAEDVAFVVSRLKAVSPVRPPATVETGRVVSFPGPGKKWLAPQQPIWRLGAAAAVILVAGLLFQLVRPGAPPLPQPPVSGGVVRGGEVEVLSPVGEVAGIPTELRWTARAGASRYRVTLSVVDDEVLWEATVPAPPASLPAEVVRGLHRAVVYFWSVEALDATGARLAISEPVRFRARPGEAGAPL
jgi:hypothetical protein